MKQLKVPLLIKVSHEIPVPSTHLHIMHLGGGKACEVKFPDFGNSTCFFSFILFSESIFVLVQSRNISSLRQRKVKTVCMEKSLFISN